MSDWYTVESLMVMGNSWNVSGMGTVYVSGLTSYTQTVSLKSTPTAKFWFPGNGVDSYLVASASITQGSLSTPVKVNGKTSFYVPKEGRWSDWVSIANFALPGDVVFAFSIASLSSKIPTASSAPTTPVGVSACEYKTTTTFLPITELDEEAGDLVAQLPFVENFPNFNNWAVLDGITPTISEGLYINLPKLTEEGHGNSTNIWINPLISHLPDKFSLEVITNCDSVPGEGCQIIIYLYTLDYAFVTTIQTYASPPPWDILYKQLENKEQKWRWEIDIANINRPIERVYYDDEFIAELVGMYFIALAGSDGYPSPSAGLQVEVNNSYDTGAACRLHIKSITITDVTTDRSLLEVTQAGTLTVTGSIAAGDTLTISGGTAGNIVFTFVDHYPNNANEIQIGVDVNATAANISTAINDITGAEFVATVASNVVTVTAHTSLSFSMSTTSSEISVGAVTEAIPGFNDETASASAVFTATEGGKSVQENASASDSMDGLIDGLTEAASATAVIDCLTDSMEEGVTCNASVNIDGLIDYMGEEI